MELTKDEKDVLAFLVKRAIEKFESEKSTILDNLSPKFLASEALNEEFLENLLKKLQ